MTRKIIYPICVLGALLLYLFSGTDAAMLILCTSIVMPIVGIITAASAARKIDVELKLPEIVQKGEAANGRIIVKNRTIFPIIRAVPKLTLCNTLTREEYRFMPGVSLAPLERRQLPFSFESVHCGQFAFGYKGISVNDFFGLIDIKKRREYEYKRLITPEMFQMHVHLSGSETPLGDENSINFNRKGMDLSEPFQLREYVEGDSLRRIHWKLSQKLEKYIVSDPSQTLERALLVFWDRSALKKEAAPDVADTLAEAVVSFCLSLIQEGIPYSVVWSTEDGRCSHIRDVSSLDDMYGIMPELFRSPSPIEGVSGIEECITRLGGKKYPLIAYFSDRVPEEAAELAGVGKVTMFICNNGEAEGDAGELSCFSFSPDNFRQVLSNVII